MMRRFILTDFATDFDHTFTSLEAVRSAITRNHMRRYLVVFYPRLTGRGRRIYVVVG